MKRSYETGQSQVAIVNEALEKYLANVAPENSDPSASNGGDGKQ